MRNDLGREVKGATALALGRRVPEADLPPSKAARLWRRAENQQRFELLRDVEASRESPVEPSFPAPKDQTGVTNWLAKFGALSFVASKEALIASGATPRSPGAPPLV